MPNAAPMTAAVAARGDTTSTEAVLRSSVVVPVDCRDGGASDGREMGFHVSTPLESFGK